MPRMWWRCPGWPRQKRPAGFGRNRPRHAPRAGPCHELLKRKGLMSHQGYDRIMASWKRVFASGLILIGPILVTLYVVYRAYAIVAGITPTAVVDAQALQGVIDNEPTRVAIAHVLRLAISLTVFVLVTIGIGTLTRTTVGDLFARGVDGVANRLPGLRVVYNASKIAAETTIGEEQALQEPR